MRAKVKILSIIMLSMSIMLSGVAVVKADTAPEVVPDSENISSITLEDGNKGIKDLEDKKITDTSYFSFEGDFSNSSLNDYIYINIEKEVKYVWYNTETKLSTGVNGDSFLGDNSISLANVYSSQIAEEEMCTASLNVKGYDYKSVLSNIRLYLWDSKNTYLGYITFENLVKNVPAPKVKESEQKQLEQEQKEETEAEKKGTDSLGTKITKFKILNKEVEKSSDGEKVLDVKLKVQCKTNTGLFADWYLIEGNGKKIKIKAEEDYDTTLLVLTLPKGTYKLTAYVSSQVQKSVNFTIKQMGKIKKSTTKLKVSVSGVPESLEMGEIATATFKANKKCSIFVENEIIMQGSKSAKYNMSSNGTYNYKAVDNEGNMVTGAIKLEAYGVNTNNVITETNDNTEQLAQTGIEMSLAMKIVLILLILSAITAAGLLIYRRKGVK